MSLNLDGLGTYRKIISNTHEDLAKDLSSQNRRPFTLPLTSDQLTVLQAFVDVVFPDLNNKVSQIEDGDPPYFSLSTSPSLIVDIPWWEKAFSYFFDKNIVLHGSPLGWANKRVHFFRLQKGDKVYNLRNNRKVVDR